MQFDENNQISIIIADDHEVVRAGIRRLLSMDKSLKILDEASNGLNAVELVNYHKPTIALLDIMMPVMSGIDAVKRIKIESPETFVVMLTAFEDSNHLEKALMAGADGYLTKDISAKDLIKSIHVVLSGERVFSKSIIMIMQNRYVPTLQNDEQITITKREQEILNLIALGKKTIEISDVLCLSSRTVETHRYNLMKKLKLNSAAELIRYAVVTSNAAEIGHQQNL